MRFAWEFPKVAAKPKKTDYEDAPQQVPMGRIEHGVRRNPDGGQRKVRVQQVRNGGQQPKTAATTMPLRAGATCPVCHNVGQIYGQVSFNGSDEQLQCARCGWVGTESTLSAEAADKVIGECPHCREPKYNVAAGTCSACGWRTGTPQRRHQYASKEAATNKYPGRCPDCGGHVPAGGGVRSKENGKWVVRHREDEHEDERAGPWRSGYGEYPMADEVYDLTHSSDYYGSKTARENPMNFVQQEAALLQAMATASLADQRKLAEALEDLRADHRASSQSFNDIEMADAVIRDTLTPVATHQMHSTATDWMAEIAIESNWDADVENSVRAEAASWYGRTDAEVRADHQEFVEQALGMARRVASVVGEVTGVAEQAFLDHACHLAGITLGAAGSDEATYTDDWGGDSGDVSEANWPITSPEGETTGDTQDWSLVPNAHASLQAQAEEGWKCDECGNTIHGNDAQGSGHAAGCSLNSKNEVKASRTASPQPGDADDSARGVSSLPNEVTLDGHEETMDNFAPPVAPENAGVSAEDTSSMRAPIIQENKQDAPESGGSGTTPVADESGQGVSKLPAPNNNTPAFSSLLHSAAMSGIDPEEFAFEFEAAAPIADPSGQGVSSLPQVDEADPATMWPWEMSEDGKMPDQGAANVDGVPTPGKGVADYPQPKKSMLAAFEQRHRIAMQLMARYNLDHETAIERAQHAMNVMALDTTAGENPFAKKEAASRDNTGNTSMAPATCAVCGSAIERDPESEENRTWHHADGKSHDHEAKPKGDSDEKKESAKTAGGLENFGDSKAKPFGQKDDDEEEDEAKEASLSPDQVAFRDRVQARLAVRA